MAKSNKHFDALCSAVYEQDLEAVVKLCSKVKADSAPYNADGDSLLMAAINSDAKLPLIQALVEQGGASYAYKGSNGTPISRAQIRDRRDVIEYFASRGAKVKYVPFANLSQAEKNQRLVAAMENLDDTLEKRATTMLDGGANPNQSMVECAEGLRSVTHYLAYQSADLPKVFTKLINAGADLGALDCEGLTVLHLLARARGEVAIAKILLKHVPIDIRDRDGRTALHHAAQAGGDTDFINMLIAQGADIHARNKAGKLAVDVAEGDGKKLLLAKMMPPISKATQALLAAISKKDLVAVKRALAAGADPSAVDVSSNKWGPNQECNGVAALHLIFLRDLDAGFADLVLAHPNLNVNVKATDGRVPMHVLLDKGQGESRQRWMAQLIEFGADVNSADDDGETPIFELLGSYKYSDELALYDTLIAAGANPKHADASGKTMLDKMWDSTQYFSEVNDKPGFVLMMSRLFSGKVPTRSTKYVKDWLATKGAKYLTKPENATGKKNGKAAKSKTTVNAATNKARELFAKITDGKLGKQVGKDAYLPIAGEPQPVALFDWFAMMDEQDADEHEYVDQIFQYHVTGKAIAHVKAGRWVPFGIVGMTGTFDSYAEIGVDGTLYVDLTAAEGADAPVVFATQSHMGLAPSNPLKVKGVTYASLIKQLKRK